jgi:hypothetical protein
MIIKAKLKYFPRVHPVIGQMPLNKTEETSSAEKLYHGASEKHLT